MHNRQAFPNNCRSIQELRAKNTALKIRDPLVEAGWGISNTSSTEYGVVVASFHHQYEDGNDYLKYDDANFDTMMYLNKFKIKGLRYLIKIQPSGFDWVTARKQCDIAAIGERLIIIRLSVVINDLVQNNDLAGILLGHVPEVLELKNIIKTHTFSNH